MTVPRRWLLALMSLLPCCLQCESLTFGQTLQLVLNRYGYLEQSSSTATQATDERNIETVGRSASELSCPIHLKNYTEITDQLAAANELSLPLGGSIFTTPPDRLSPGAFNLDSRKNVILCTTLLYVKLGGLEAQQRVLSQQQEFVNRLIDIESRRVSFQVDHPLLLTQAKLLRARTRAEWAALSASERKTRTALSTLVGRPAGLVDPVADSMPPLPDNLTGTVEGSELLRQLMAYRDIAQLDYVSEFLSRLKAAHDMELAKASIGSLVAAHVTEEIKFIGLLKFNDEIRAARIQFLAASGDLEDWSFQRATPNSKRSPTLPKGQASNSTAPADSSLIGTQVSSLLSILITPATKDLQVGRSQQYSAIATYSDGHAKDVTSEATWSCSSDTGAILSTTGLLTGLSVGTITVKVEFQDLTHSRNLSIVKQPLDEYLGHDQ